MMGIERDRDVASVLVWIERAMPSIAIPARQYVYTLAERHPDWDTSRLRQAACCFQAGYLCRDGSDCPNEREAILVATERIL
jgi:hypothetical protein